VQEPHVTPETVKVIRGEGMPNQKRPQQKGNLRIKFNIQFPVLNDQQKAEIRTILRQAR
jgi:DnaJ-class molecular chaperone